MQDIAHFIATLYPYSTLPEEERSRLAAQMQRQRFQAGDRIYAQGSKMPGLFVVQAGLVHILDANGEQISALGAGNSFGERGLLAGGIAATQAQAAQDCTLLLLPAAAFHEACAALPELAEFFQRGTARKLPARPKSLATTRLADIMSPDPATLPGQASIAETAALMRDRRISSVLIAEGDTLHGIVTIRDMATKAVAEALDPTQPIAEIMTPNPEALPPGALGSDVLHAMAERRISHVPVVEAGRLVGIVTQTDLTRQLADNSANLVRGIAQASKAEEIAKITARIPALLVSLVGAGNRHEVVTRLITDIADAATRRLLHLAEADLGPPPVPYLWAACGSQGRQEQTGVSDQDNCLILSDEARPEHDAYFSALAQFTCEGLAVAGYYLCPGDMMATNPKWRQPMAQWRRYFSSWITKPDTEAQMLASVMFDLRPIGGDTRLFEGLQAETLAASAQNSIFVAHMASNALKHTPPLSLFRGIATERGGAHSGKVDLKHSGVVPVTDLGRVYSLRKQIGAVNTRARLEAAIAQGAVSTKGGRDLLDAYDLIAEARLSHQAAQIRAGQQPDNHLDPKALSEFERSHLRDAFVVVRSMQSALSQSAGGLM